MKQTILAVATLLMQRFSKTSTKEVKDACHRLYNDPTFALTQREVSDAMADLYSSEGWQRHLNTTSLPGIQFYEYSLPQAKPVVIIDPVLATRIEALIVNKFGFNANEVSKNKNLFDDLGLDSLDAIELVMDMEREFNMSIPDDEVEKIKTVGEIIEYISGRQSGSSFVPQSGPMITPASALALSVSTTALDPANGNWVAYISGKHGKYIQTHSKTNAKREAFQTYNPTEIGLTYDDINLCSVKYFNSNHLSKI